MNTKEKNIYPECFGDLKTVFPLADDGLRQTPETCLACAHKTICLRKAMGQGDGLAVREEVVDRAYASGLIGFWQRWSRKKNLQRRISKSSDAKDGNISKKE